MNSLGKIWIDLFGMVPPHFTLGRSEDDDEDVGREVQAYYRWIEDCYPTVSAISRAFSAQENSMRYPPTRKVYSVAAQAEKAFLERKKWLEIVSKPIKLTPKMWENPKEAFPCLPLAVEEFLNEECTIWVGYKRRVTHLVIPPIFFQDDEKPLTLERLSEINRFLNGIGCSLISAAEALTSPRSAPWGVVTILPIPLTQELNKTFVERKHVVEARGYQVPHALDLVLALFFSQRYSVNPEDPHRFARVQGQWGQQMTLCADRIEPGQVIVGPLTRDQLLVRNSVLTSQKPFLGIVGCKFFT